MFDVLLLWSATLVHAAPLATEDCSRSAEHVVRGHFALDGQRWEAVDALSWPAQQPPGARWLVVSSRPFDRFAMAAAGKLSAQAMEIHRRRLEAATLSLLVSAEGRVLRADYGWGGAELDSPVDFQPGWVLQCDTAARLAGTLRHDWVELRFDVPVQKQVEPTGAAAPVAAEHPAATTLQRMDAALRAQDAAAWTTLFQPPGYQSQPGDVDQMKLMRQLIPRVERIDAVVVENRQARVQFRSGGEPHTAVMQQEDDGRWMLEQVGPSTD